MYLLGASAVGWGLAAGNRRLRQTGIAILVSVALADLTKRSVKAAVRRSRPVRLLDEGIYQSGAGGANQKPEQSFPSGHVAGSVAAACAIGRFYPEARGLALTGAAVVAVTRLLKGAHWPLDIAAGTLIGFVANRLDRRLMSARRV